MDLDAVYFMMLMKSNLLNLIKLIAYLANHKIKVKDFTKFNNLLHIISDQMVIKIYIGGNIE